jgi:hypothetical protein
MFNLGLGKALMIFSAFFMVHLNFMLLKSIH